MSSCIRLMSVVGARPNFMKIAPFLRALSRHASTGAAPAFSHQLVHTGQHYDAAMSAGFFETLKIPAPDLNLEIGSGTHGEQVGRTLIAFERVLMEHRPDWVIVVGDVNATCACALAAKKLNIRVAHIEAGLRSFDMTMPEEINRLVTDRLSDLLLTPDRFAEANLRQEGVPPAHIVPVGNIMIDTLDANRERAVALNRQEILTRQAIPGQDAALARVLQSAFGVVTLHRPANVDEPDTLRALARFLETEASPALPLIWALHPRTRTRLQACGLWEGLLASPRLLLVEPLDYLEMLNLNLEATVFLTDSGGLQEECCVLGTPCLTLRATTERPITLEDHGGVSRLVGHDMARIREGFEELRQRPRQPFRPPLWDGHTGDRVVAALAAASGHPR